MSYKEFNAAIADPNNASRGVLPPIGGSTKLPKGTKVKVRYFSAMIDDPNGVATLEDIMTRSMDSEGVLKDVGDTIVIREDTHFTKDGEYIAAIKYVELQQTTPNKKPEKAMSAVDEFDSVNGVNTSKDEIEDVDLQSPVNHDF